MKYFCSLHFFKNSYNIILHNFSNIRCGLHVSQVSPQWSGKYKCHLANTDSTELEKIRYNNVNALGEKFCIVCFVLYFLSRKHQK